MSTRTSSSGRKEPLCRARSAREVCAGSPLASRGASRGLIVHAKAYGHPRRPPGFRAAVNPARSQSADLDARSIGTVVSAVRAGFPMRGPLSHERAAALEASGIWARWLGEGEALGLIRDRLRSPEAWRAFVATGHDAVDDATSRGGSPVDAAWPVERLARLRLRVRAILFDPSLERPGFEPRGEDVYHTAEDDEEDWEAAVAHGALDELLRSDPRSGALGSTSSGPRRPGRPARTRTRDPRRRTFRDPTRIAPLFAAVGVSEESPESIVTGNEEPGTRAAGPARDRRAGRRGRTAAGADPPRPRRRPGPAATIRPRNARESKTSRVPPRVNFQRVNFPGRKSTSASRRRSRRRLFAPTTTAGPGPSTTSGGTARWRRVCARSRARAGAPRI